MLLATTVIGKQVSGKKCLLLLFVIYFESCMYKLNT